MRPRLSRAFVRYARASESDCPPPMLSRSTPLASLSNSAHSPNRPASAPSFCRSAAEKTRPSSPAVSNCMASLGRMASTWILCVATGSTSSLRVVMRRAQRLPPWMKGLRCAAFQASSITSRMSRSASSSARRAVAASMPVKPGRS